MARAAVNRGLRLSVESWNTIWMRLRSGSLAKDLAGIAPMSSPSNMVTPSLLSMSRITMVEVVDLPQPDSPTKPTLSPRATVKLMPSTARNVSGSGAGRRAKIFANGPHGRLRGLDLSAVREAEGVIAVVTAADIPGVNDVGPIQHDDPIFAHETVEFVGQPVFAVAATDVRLARRGRLEVPRVAEADVLHPVDGVAQHDGGQAGDGADHQRCEVEDREPPPHQH